MAITTPKIAANVPKRGSNPSAKTAAEVPKENSVTRLMKKIWKPRRDIGQKLSRIGSLIAKPVRAKRPMANKTVMSRIR